MWYAAAVVVVGAFVVVLAPTPIDWAGYVVILAGCVWFLNSITPPTMPTHIKHPERFRGREHDDPY